MNKDTEIPIPGSRFYLLGELYELTRINAGFAHLRGVEVKRERSLALAEFARKQQSGDLRLAMNAPIQVSNAPLAATLSDNDRKKYERRLAYVQEVRRGQGGCLPRPSTRNMIKSVAACRGDDRPPSYETLCLWWRRFRQANGNPLALVDLGAHCRPRAPRLNEVVSNLMDAFLRQDYLKIQRPTGQCVYDLLVNQIRADNSHRGPLEQLPIPARATFYRRLAKLDPYLVDLARFGRQTARKQHRYGRSIQPPVALGERVEADCCHLDVLVVDERGALIGRPWLCALIDVTSRCVIGWELSFTPPCGAKVLRALRVAMSDATPSAYGVVPQELVLDNGPEFQNSALQTVAGTYGITLRYVAPRSPNEKPHIERFFGTFNTTLVHMMPGTTWSSPSDRGEYPSESKACLSLPRAREYVAFWLENVYHRALHSGLGTSPSEVWRMASQRCPPQRYPAADLDLTCRSFVMRAIRGGRVNIMNLEWSGPSLPDVNARLAIQGAGRKAKVFYDETDLSCVWVEDPDDRSILFRAEAVRPEYQNGLSLYEHQLLSTNHRDKGRALTPDAVLESKAMLYRDLGAQGHRARKQRARLVEPNSQLFGDGASIQQPLGNGEPARKPLAGQRPEVPPEPGDGADYTGFLLERH
jgi:putative transposase